MRGTPRSRAACDKESQTRTVRAPGHRVDIVGVATQFGDLLAAGYVKKADAVVATAGGQSSAVGTKRHAEDRALLGDHRDAFVVASISKADRLVVRGGGPADMRDESEVGRSE